MSEFDILFPTPNPHQRNADDMGMPPVRPDLPIPSAVTRLTKGYANQKTDGTYMVDLIDSANGNIIARCVYEPYADEIIAACRRQGLARG